MPIHPKYSQEEVGGERDLGEGVAGAAQRWSETNAQDVAQHAADGVVEQVEGVTRGQFHPQPGAGVYAQGDVEIEQERDQGQKEETEQPPGTQKNGPCPPQVEEDGGHEQDRGQMMREAKAQQQGDHPGLGWRDIAATHGQGGSQQGGDQRYLHGVDLGLGSLRPQQRIDGKEKGGDNGQERRPSRPFQLRCELAQGFVAE